MNPVGTAPGFHGRLARCEFWALPGVPQEVTEMVRAVAEGVGRLPGGGLPAGFAWERIVATLGVGEVRVAERLETGGFVVPPGVRLAFLPSAGGVRLRLAAPEGAPIEVLDHAESDIRALLGAWVLPFPGVAESLVRALAAQRRTLATAESCTGGLLGARITDGPGSSSVYLGGIVSYANRIKAERLGVPSALLEEHGAVSEPVANAMAVGARRELGADIATAITGVAGPGGGTPAKPVGTVWIAVADSSGDETFGFRFLGNREMVRERSVQKAMELVYRRLRGAPAP
jgi:nicotinamide-nucleotide amidase